MKYIVDLDYNNNSIGLINLFEKPEDAESGGEVIVTNAGILFFRLHRFWMLEDKIGFTRLLQANLQSISSGGLVAATCADSDCVEKRDVVAFFKAAKEICPSIKTVFCGSKEGIVKADRYITRLFRGKPTALGGIIGVTDDDKKEPEKGWLDFSFDLYRLFAQTQLEYEKKKGPRGFKLPGHRPAGEDARHFETLRNIHDTSKRVMARLRPQQA